MNAIANIHEIDQTAGGQIFIVMAHYEGDSLNDRIAEYSPAGGILSRSGEVVGH